jgi:hypothetical protein
MIPNEHAAQNTLDGIHDALRSGAPLTPRLQARTHAALRTLRDERGADAANTARCKLRLVALCRAAELMGMKKSTRAARSTPVRSRGVVHPTTGKRGVVVRREPGAVYIAFD